MILTVVRWGNGVPSKRNTRGKDGRTVVEGDDGVVDLSTTAQGIRPRFLLSKSGSTRDPTREPSTPLKLRFIQTKGEKGGGGRLTNGHARSNQEVASSNQSRPL